MLDKLPSEIVLLIFKYLNMAELGRTTRVCVKLKPISEDNSLWKSVALNYLSNKNIHVKQNKFAIVSDIKGSFREFMTKLNNFSGTYAKLNLLLAHERERQNLSKGSEEIYIESRQFNNAYIFSSFGFWLTSLLSEYRNERNINEYTQKINALKSNPQFARTWFALAMEIDSDAILKRLSH